MLCKWNTNAQGVVKCRNLSTRYSAGVNLSEISTPNTLEFIQWQKAIAKLNLNVHLVLKYALDMCVERIEDGNNDHQLSDAVRFAFMDMFYGFPHPQISRA